MATGWDEAVAEESKHIVTRLRELKRRFPMFPYLEMVALMQDALVEASRQVSK
jgi:hypothetical protein